MTRYVAFANDAGIQSALLARLDTYLANGTVSDAGVRRTGSAGPPSGCIASHAGPGAFESTTGYPAGLAFLLDYLFARTIHPGDAARLAVDWFGRTTPGSDLDGVPGRLLVFMLSSTLARAEPTMDAPDVAASLHELLELHHQAIAGTPLDRAGWSIVRAKAIAGTDAARTPLGRACGRMAEAAAWDPLISRSTLADVGAHWCEVGGQIASAATGWTAQDDAAFHECTEVFRNEIMRSDTSLHTTDFPPFFEARQPDLHARFITQLERTNAAFTAAVGELARASLDCLAEAPCRRGPR